MAAPVLLNFRIVPQLKENQDDNKFYLAISHFGFNDSGFMVECEFDASEQHPWGVRVMDLRLGDSICYFNMMRAHFASVSEDKDKSADQIFADAMSSNISSHLNAYYGATPQGTPISLPKEEFVTQFSEQVFTITKSPNVDMQFEFMPLNLDMKSLYNGVFGDHKFNEGLPAHILNPPSNQTEEGKPTH